MSQLSKWFGEPGAEHAERVVLSLDARLTRNLDCDHLLVVDETGAERVPTFSEVGRIANGYRVLIRVGAIGMDKL